MSMAQKVAAILAVLGCNRSSIGRSAENRRPTQQLERRYLAPSHALAALAILLGSSSASFAQVSTHPSYEELLRRGKSLASLGDDLFGDRINLQDGTLSFSQQDVVLDTNSELKVSIGRKTPMSEQGKDGPYAIFGSGWEPDLPFMMGSYDTRDGWNSRGSVNRCSSGDMVPKEPYGPYPNYYTQIMKASLWWHGINISVPAQGEEKLLRVNAGQILPTDGKTYVGTTKSSWRVSCLPTIKNGSGEGFAVTLPNGTTYFFDWMATRNAIDFHSGCPLDANGDCNDSWTRLVPRSDIYLYATKVVDRFGNWVAYNYDAARPNRIVSIVSNDGVRLDIAYNASGQISKVTSGARSWTYAYTPVANSSFSRLTSLTLPDSSAWTFSTSVDIPRYTAAAFWDNACGMDPGSYSSTAPPPANPYTITMVHPSGAQGVFKLRPMFHGTNNTPGGCNYFGTQTNLSWGTYGVPAAYVAASLFQKIISGAAMAPRSWSYQYSPSWSFDPAFNSINGNCGNPCATTSQTAVTSNDGVTRRLTFGNSYHLNMGQLVFETVEKGGQVVRRKNYSYLTTAAGQPFPANAGDIPKGAPNSIDGVSYWYNYGNPFLFLNLPLRTVSVQQDGVTFSRTINSFDAFVRPLNVSKSSTISGNPIKTEATGYHDDRALWVLGQIKLTTVNGIEASKTDYGWKALPWKTYAFGKLQQTLAYDSTSTVASGQLGKIKTVTDGRNNVTTLTGWKRGIPGKITYPATTDQPTAVFQQAAINDDGTIASVTDETLSKTCYEYDEMLRIEKIIYPSETANVCDGSKWSPTTITFKAGNPEAYGVPAGHWRQTVLTGRGRKILILDALWRPVVEQTLDLDRVSTTTSEVIKRYDAAGRLAFQSYPMNTGGAAVYTDTTLKGTDYTYDALDRPLTAVQDSELGALTTRTEYLTGFQTRVTNPRLKQTLTTLYQAFDQPTYDFPRGIAHPTDASTPASFTEIYRDIFGKPTSIKRRNTDGTVAATRSYAYHASQELCRAVEPETGATLMGYDGAGNLAWSASGLPAATTCDIEGDTTAILARKAARTYDTRNRLKTLSFPGGNGNQTWAYAPDGLPVSVVANNVGGQQATTTYAYNRRRLLESENLQYGSVLSWPVDYVYNTNGHLSAQVWHGLSVGYAPDALGRPTQAGTFASGVSYYPNGAMKQFTYGNGIIHQLTQNVRGLPRRSLDIYGSTHQLDDTYDFDQNGNVLAISDGRDAAQRRNVDMTYDALDRLTSATSPMFGTATYTYDVLDNLSRTQVTGGNAIRNHHYCYNTQWRLAFVRKGAVCTGATPSEPVWALDYDVQGNLTDKNAQTFAFDYGNRLRSVNAPASTYAYDGLGRRVWDRTTDDKYSHYLQNGQLSMTGDERAKEVAEYIYLQGSVVAIRERNTVTNVYTTKYQHTDALGSPVAVTDANRALIAVEKNEFEPYGRVANRALTDGPNYTGHVADAATGLVYAQQRYYDPMIGRFLSVDPVTADRNTGANFNRYKYAANNPYRFIDPDGRCEKAISGFHTDCKPRNVGAAAAGAAAIANENSWKPLSQLVANLLRGFGVSLPAAATAATTGGAAAMVYSPELGDGSLTGNALRDLAAPIGSWQATQGQPVYRIWGGGASAFGASWTPINPVALSLAGYDVRDIAGLPDVNTGQFVTTGILRNPAGVIQIRAAFPLDGNQGGLVEYVIPNPANYIQYLNTLNVNPSF